MANTLKFGNGKWYGKEGTILAYNDENYNYKPLPFSFERGSSATVVNKDGLIETVGSGQPRIDYKDDSKGALKLEPQRTNVITYSEAFDNSYWLKSLTSITANQLISPDGTQNADTLTKNADYGSIYRTGLSATSGSNYTFSLFVKKGTTDFVSLRQASGSNDVRKQFNLNTGEVTNGLGGNQIGFVSSEFKEYSNEWYRLSITCTSNDTSITASIYSGKVGESTFNGDSYIWGAQLEEGSFSTSLINTQGSAVTRLAESCEQTVPDGVIGQTEGTIYFETEINGLQGGDMRFQLSDGSTNNWIFISSGEATGIGVKARAYINNGNVNQFNAYSEYLSAGKHKYALAYNQNDIAFYVDGVQVSLDTSATIPSCDEITLSGSTPTNVNASHFLSYKDIKLYKTRLSNSELATLTQV